MFKRIGFPYRTLKLEARVGNKQLLVASTGRNQIKFNHKCGKTSGSKSVMIEEFECSPPLDGQFISLQNTDKGEMNIGELAIFAAGTQNHLMQYSP